MQKLSWRDAIAVAESAHARWPSAADVRVRDQRLFPQLSPRFQFERGSKVFTIGSCFARHIEEKLEGFDLPTRRFGVPHEEWPFRPNGIRNEYNPATMAQRIKSGVERKAFDDRAIGQSTDGRFVDLLLVANAPVSMQRLAERRREVDAVYAELTTSDVVIITLGLVEAWYDNEDELYLNTWPTRGMAKNSPGRYELRVLDVGDAYPLLDESLSSLISSGVRKILLTVSPVPLNTTFGGTDCILANSFSKAVLRVCAERLSRQFREVDYFPSFEIVTSGGLASFDPDLTHVRDGVVESVIRHMLTAYGAAQPAPAGRTL